MREILFRGKRVDNGEWIEGGYAENGGKTFIIVRTRYIPDTRDWDAVEYYENNPCYHLSMIEVDPETVCQYTGLTDKNGRKIFEGDILSFSAYGENYKGDVRVIKGNFTIWCGKCAPFLDDALEKHSAIVIGNIFDNPELIGEQP